jgi:copper resistance protein B
MKTGLSKHGSRFSARALGVVNALHCRRLLLAGVVLLATIGSMNAQTLGGGNSGKMPPPVMDHETFAHVLFDQFEGRSNGSQNQFRWDGEGWIGTDMNRLWLKSEGFADQSGVSDGDHEVLYDRPIPRMRYFDAQAGVRADLDSDPSRVWAAIGIEGLAPYFFQLAPTFYIRNDGHLAGRINASYDVSLSQRLIVQPQAELNFYSKDDPARKIGSGFSDLDAGIRLRYVISRKFSPYVGFAYDGKYGGTAGYARAAGERTATPSFVFGIRIWR